MRNPLRSRFIASEPLRGVPSRITEVGPVTATQFGSDAVVQFVEYRPLERIEIGARDGQQVQPSASVLGPDVCG
ncbi:unannotated protein [freshwater metagenome]|uniref:Unannotated protein n=1 Tax=freshwater metagenome TaxID=449393 RepID=A0A6J7ENQ8_9ZZZZ